MLYRHIVRPALFAVGRDPEVIHERVLGMRAAGGIDEQTYARVRGYFAGAQG